MTSSVPEHDVPDFVRGLTDGGAVCPVWRNDAGGTTYAIDTRQGSCYVKWQPPHDEVSLDREYDKLLWAGAFTSVPTPVDVGVVDGHSYLVTAAIDGVSAVDPRWVAHPEDAVRAVGRGLRALHEEMPVSACPWIWSPESRIADAKSRGMSVSRRLGSPPPTDVLVVCHGDACCPNTLLDAAGDWVGHVDIGALGVADRWADIAVAAMSTRWNYGRGWEGTLIRAYGVVPDEERLSYYRRLWNAT